jgi:hypothetical protein
VEQRRETVSWEIYEKTTTRRSSDPTLTISKKFGRLSFNASTAEQMKKNAMETVLLMWDAESKQIGIRNVMKKDPRAYTLHFSKKQYGAGFAARPFLHHIGYDYSITRSFPCEWNEHDGIFVVQLTDEAFAQKSSRVAKLPIARGRGGSEASGTKASAAS